MVDAPCKEAMLKVLAQQPSTTECFKSLVKVPSSVVKEKALTLLGNMCGDTGLRQALQAQPTLLSAVVDAVVASSKQEDLTVCVAATTTLYNLALDSPTQEVVAGGVGLPGLMALAKHSDARLVSRAVGALSRTVKHPKGLQRFSELKGLPLAMNILEAAMQEGSSVTVTANTTITTVSSSERNHLGSELAPVVDAVVRILALMTSGAGGKANVDALIAMSDGLDALLGLLKAPWVTEASLGNAALCISNVAAHRDHLPKLKSKDAVAPLVKVAYDGKGNTASKNAAIALAKMAQDPGMLERLRELHGIEIIYQYVKP